MIVRTYLDWNASAPLRPEARAAVTAALDLVGNPSSVHGEGRAARQLMEDARGRVAALVGALPRNVVFTSGGTEANRMALCPGLQVTHEQGCNCLLVSAIEHPSVLSGGSFPHEARETVPVTADGRADLGELQRRLDLAQARHARPLVSLMLANNETGVIQPVAKAAELVHRAGGLLHVDAVQAAGRISIDINMLEADLVTISAHKMGGPKGVGALVKRREDLHIPVALIAGGGQERGQRAGTENVAGIAGFGAAAEAAGQNLAEAGQRSLRLRDRLEAGLLAVAPQTVIFGRGVDRVPNTVLFAVPGIKAETALIALDLDGVAVSSGAACSSGKVSASHVLSAMGTAPDLAHGAIRVSFGYSTTEQDIDRLLQAWRTRVEALPERRQGKAA
jgi:cysteine desulfurase